MKVYIAGPITGVSDYYSKFKIAELRLTNKGYNVVNPAKNQGYSYKEYIDMGIFELMHCDAIYLLEGWDKSPGATLEYRYAFITGMDMIFESEDK